MEGETSRVDCYLEQVYTLSDQIVLMSFGGGNFFHWHIYSVSTEESKLYVNSFEVFCTALTLLGHCYDFNLKI